MKVKILFNQETVEIICNALGIEILTTEKGVKSINQNGTIILLDDIIAFHKDIGAITNIEQLYAVKEEIKIGTIMIAIDPCTMNDGTGKDALVVGKEYVVERVDNLWFDIYSEVDDAHSFPLDDYKDVLKIKQ